MPNNVVDFSVLMSRVRQRADMENSTFVSDLEIRTWLNSALAELHDIMVLTFEDYYVNSGQTYTLPGDNPGTLPADFYKAVGVDFNTGGITHTVKPYSFQERNMYQSNAGIISGNVASLRYNIQDDKIKFIPETPPSGTVTLHYIPECQQFDVAGADDHLNIASKAKSVAKGYEEYLVVATAIRCLLKEESDVRMLLAEKTDLQKRIEGAAPRKDAGHPHKIVDVTVGTNSGSYINFYN
jgi:hypothetical protein|tara:strand:- start:21588 stop:22304 length:717 start_codon:yes stop_codon:yes gene_type:complete